MADVEQERMKFYVSIGDMNGVGVEIALNADSFVREYYSSYDILYGVDSCLLERARALINKPHLDSKIPSLSVCQEDLNPLFAEVFPDSPLQATLASLLAPLEFPSIQPGVLCGEMGLLSGKSFLYGILLAQQKKVDALITLPIHKQAWHKAKIPYAGHTELLRALYQKDAIMALGCKDMMIFLYTDHIPLRDVAMQITEERFLRFLLNVQGSFKDMESCGVLGLNPHAGDQGIIGDEEEIIASAIAHANECIGQEFFYGPLVPDSAFIPHNRHKFKYYVALYHDQGLIPLKAFYFEQSVNISLGLPIVRISVDHGTAFDIAYKNQRPSLVSYMHTFAMAERVIQ